MVATLTGALDRVRQSAERSGSSFAWPPPPPPGWAHLPIAVHDLVWNLGRDYDAVTRPIITAYAKVAEPHVNLRTGDLLAGHSAALEEGHRPHSVTEAVELLSSLGAVGRLTLAEGNRSPAHTRPGAPLRSDTVLVALKRFAETKIETLIEARDVFAHEKGRQVVRRAIRGTPGLGDAAEAYFPMLIGKESIKPDTHVTRWFGRLGIPAKDIRAVTIAAVDQLNSRGEEGGWTVAGIDHAIWRTQSRRPLL